MLGVRGRNLGPATRRLRRPARGAASSAPEPTDRPDTLPVLLPRPARAPGWRGRGWDFRGDHDGSSRGAIDAFKAELDRAGVPATVRLTRGRDIGMRA